MSTTFTDDDLWDDEDDTASADDDPWADTADDGDDDDDYLLERPVAPVAPKPKGKFKRPPLVKVAREDQDSPKPKRVRVPKVKAAPRPIEPVRELAPGEAPTVGRAIISGHCANPQTVDPHLSHERCAKRGGGSDATPGRRVWHPCPCGCHLDQSPEFDGLECDNCGGAIKRTTYWLGTGEETYVHVDPVTGRSTGEEC